MQQNAGEIRVTEKAYSIITTERDGPPYTLQLFYFAREEKDFYNARFKPLLL